MYSRAASSRRMPCSKSTRAMVSSGTSFRARMRSSITELQAPMCRQVRRAHTGISVDTLSRSSRVTSRPSAMVSWFQPMPMRYSGLSRSMRARHSSMSFSMDSTPKRATFFWNRA